MSFFSRMHPWLRYLGKQSRKRQPIRAARLGVEALECRLALSGNQHLLAIIGNSGGTAAPSTAPQPVSSPDTTRLVTGLYYDVLGHQPTRLEVSGWANSINHGASTAAVARGFVNSAEFRSRALTRDYQTFLTRAPETGALDNWLQIMDDRGLSSQQVAGMFLSSEEFFQKQGGNNSAWLKGLYQDLFSRTPSSSEIDSWNSALNQGMSRDTVARDFVKSPEEINIQIGQQYDQLLGRKADAFGLSAWSAAMQQGMSLEEVVVGITTSPEYKDDQSQIDLQFADPETPQPLDNGLLLPADLGGSQPSTGSGGSGGTQSGGGSGDIGIDNGVPQSSNPPVSLTGGPGVIGNRGGGNGGGGVVFQDGGPSRAGSGSSGGTGSGSTGGGSPGQLTGPSGTGGGGSATSGILNDPLFTNPNDFVRFNSTHTLTVGKNIDTNRQFGNQSESVVAIDPTNPKRMVVFANNNAQINAAGSGMTFSYSTDGGLKWHTRIIGTGFDGFPLVFSDPSLAWDSFGNLFVVGIAQGAAGFNAATLLSIDGGKSFDVIDVRPVFDQTTVVAGPGVVWFTEADTNVSQLVAWGAPVNGLGKVGPMTKNFLMPNAAPQNFGDIAIGPTGQVIVAGQSNAGRKDRTKPDAIRIWTKADGLGTSNFIEQPSPTNTNLIAISPVIPQQSRGAIAQVDLAYDRSGRTNNGRAYMLYTDKPTVFSTNTIIFSRFSDDDGKTWSDPVRVNDDLGNISAVHFQPALAVDQTTGFIAAAWYDTRNDPGSGPGDRDKIANTDVEVFATVSFDGGVTWQPNIQVASGPSNSQSFDFNTGNQFGDYIGLAYNNGVFFPTWTDNNPLQLSNPDRGTGFDIFTARVVVNAPPTMLPEDRFEPNDSSARATALGTLLDPVTLTGLTINIHANGLPDNDWFRMNTGGPGVFTAKINYKSPDLGDLQMRVFTVNSKGTLIQLGSSRNVGVKTQTVSFDVFNDIPIYVWIYGNNGAQATYDMTVSVA